MSERFEKALQDLNKQKEDIELLLTSLEDAYAEAAITEKHYNELRSKNKKKLDEITDKIETVKSRQEKTEKRDTKERKKVEKKENGEKPPKTEKPEPPAAAKEEAATTTPKAPEKATDTPEVPMGTPEPTEGDPEVPMGTPEPTEGDRRNITENDFKGIMTKIFENAKLIDLAEITPKLEKMTAEIEKMKAHIEATREQRNTDTDRSSRINEELGELRSGFHTNEGRLSEMEMKIKDHDLTLSELKPQKYSRSIQNIDRALKMHEGRLDKHDDLTSMIMKRITGIKNILEQFGSMEQIARMNQETSKKLIGIDEREKRIKRVSDRLDGIFSELNKRLDEFIFYKAKQDNVGELVDELLRNIEEMGAKLGKFAEKTDLELMRESLEDQIASSGPSKTGMSLDEKRLQSQKDEINSLISLLEEQHNKKSIPDLEYEKAKAENTKKLNDLDIKIAALGVTQTPASGTTTQSPETATTPTTEPIKEPETEPPAEEEPAETTKEAPEATKPPESKEEEPKEEPPAEPEPTEIPPEKEPETEEPETEEPETAEPPESKEEEPKEEKPKSMMGSILKKLESIPNMIDDKPKKTPEPIEEPLTEPETPPAEPKEPEPSIKPEAEELPPTEPKEDVKAKPPKEKPIPKKPPKEPEEEPPPVKSKDEPKEPPKEKPIPKKPPEEAAKKKNLTMLETLEQSFKGGMITKEAYERTRKVLEKKQG